MQQRIHTQVCRLNRGSLSWTELQLGNCKLQKKNNIRKPRALLQSGPTSQLTYSLRGEHIFQSQWAINLNTSRYSRKDMKTERASWTKEERLPCSVHCALGLWAPENTVSLSQRTCGAHSMGFPDGCASVPLPLEWGWALLLGLRGSTTPLLTPDNVALLIRVSVTHV